MLEKILPFWLLQSAYESPILVLQTLQGIAIRATATATTTAETTTFQADWSAMLVNSS
jgi:hypothetical protein